MSNTIKLLEKVRSTLPNQSRRQLAAATGIDRGNLNQMYRGKRYPNALQALKIAEILRTDPGDVIALIYEDKARGADTKEQVRLRLPRIPPAACFAVACLVGALITTGETAHAREKGVDDTLYIMRNWIASLRKILRNKTHKKQHRLTTTRIVDLAAT